MNTATYTAAAGYIQPKYFSSKADMETYLTSPSYGIDTTNFPELCFGVSVVQNGMDYKVYMHYEDVEQRF